MENSYIIKMKDRVQVLALSILTWAACAYVDPISAEEWSYSVRPGDNLWEITEKFLIDQSFREKLAEHNDIAVSDHIEPGTLLRVPLDWLRIQPASATLVLAQGSVWAKLASDGSTKSADLSGLTLRVKDSVTTGENGLAIIELADKSRITVFPNSSITLDSLSSYDDTGMIDTSFRLRGGHIESQINPKREPNTRFRVLTPPAIAGVKGTKFDMSYQAKSDTTLAEVRTGSIGVSAEGQEIVVNEGFGSVTKKGQPPGTPSKLLPKTDLSALPKVVSELGVEFGWPTLIDAASYRVHVFDADTNAIIHSLETQTPAIQFDRLRAGEYTLRVQAVDQLNLRGSASEHNFKVAELPATPILRSPEDNSLQLGENLSFDWEKTNLGGTYIYQISADRNFSSVIHSEERKNSDSLVLPISLDPDTYYWRVAARDEYSISSDWSEVLSFTVVIQPVKASILQTLVSGNNIEVSWKPINGAINYELQVSENEKFDPAIETIATTQTTMKLTLEDRDQAYLRLRARGELNSIGEYSDVVIAKTETNVGVYILLLFLFSVFAAILTLTSRRYRK
ncbi:MAG: FecR domain-containing protein [Pseudomonadota bacterium]